MKGNALPSGHSNEMGAQKEVPLRKTTSAHVGEGSWWLTLKPFVNAGLAQTVSKSMQLSVLDCILNFIFHFPYERFHRVELKKTKEQYMVMRKHIPLVILRSSLMKTVSVGSYEVLKKQAANARGMPLTLYQDACCGLLAGSIGAYICAPLTAAWLSIYADSKQPAAKRVNYRSMFDAMYRIGANEGLPALWKRSAPSIKGTAAYHTGMLPSYNLSKEFCRVDLGFDESKAQLAAGAISGFFGTVCSEPVLTVARKVHYMRPDADGKYPYKGILDCACKLWKAGRLSALYPEFLLKSSLSALQAMIFWTIFEKIRLFEEAQEIK